jgi:xanthine dehydrogenase accessory factor
LVALQDFAPDPWTAIAVATHDLEVDEEVLVPALRSPAAYVGVLGSRRRLPERVARLAGAGLTETEIQRLRAPIGLPIRARSPMEVAISVVGEIIASATAPAPEPARSKGSGLAGNS